jgi:hypothetical protein
MLFYISLLTMKSSIAFGTVHGRNQLIASVMPQFGGPLV